jgi:prepilin signal peptidase PulO-like enzyme (type II secretory pathway)
LASGSTSVMIAVIVSGSLGATAVYAAGRLSDALGGDARSRVREPWIIVGASLALAVAGSYLAIRCQPLDAYSRIVFCAALLCSAIVDARTRLIPDVVSIPGAVLAFIAGALIVAGVGWRAAVAGIIAAVVLMLAGELYRSWRGQEGIGMGDIKLMLMIGGFSGLPGLLFSLAFGGISATIFAALQRSVGKEGEAAGFMQTTFAFGPHLCAAAAAYILFQSRIVAG